MADAIHHFTLEKSVNSGTSWSFVDTNIDPSARSYSDSSSPSPGQILSYRLTGYTNQNVTISYNNVDVSTGYVNYAINFTTIYGSKNLPSARASMADAVVGSSIYLYGGRLGPTPSNNIWIASVDSPDVVTDTGKSLPFSLAGQRVIVISGSMYMYGGYNGSAAVTTILSASTSDPTTWGICGNILPIGLIEPSVFITSGKVWVAWGGTGTTNLPTSKVYTASISNPTFFGLAGDTGIDLAQMSVVQEDDKLYAYGGIKGFQVYPNVIYTASRLTPTVWATFPASYSQGSPSPVIAVGDRHFRLGGESSNGAMTQAVYYFTADNPTLAIFSAFTIPSPVASQNIVAYTSSNGAPFVVMYGGGASNTSINTVQRIAVDSSITSSAASHSYEEMQPWKRLIAHLT